MLPGCTPLGSVANDRQPSSFGGHSRSADAKRCGRCSGEPSLLTHVSMATRRVVKQQHSTSCNCSWADRYSEWMQEERSMAMRVAIYARVSTDDKGQDP